MRTDPFARISNGCFNFIRLFLVLWGIIPQTVFALEAVPDKLVVLTFDDSVASHYQFVAPLLKKYGFSATFFITEGFSFRTNKKDYMTWDQIADLHRQGFEIGNHTRDHASVKGLSAAQCQEQLDAINKDCELHHIPRPVSFAYPGNTIGTNIWPILRQTGVKFCRRGGAPEETYESGRGVAYEPGKDHPYLIPSTGDAKPTWTLEDFKRAVDQAHEGCVAVIQFHGVPDNEHAWVNTPPENFQRYMDYLHANHFKVIAMRDLAKYVDPNICPADPFAIMNQRKNLKGVRATVK